MSLSDILKRFAQGTTMHGVSRAIQARSTVTRVFWLAVLGIAACAFVYQFASLLWKFYSYQTKVTIEVSNTPVPFPSVSLCNMRHLDNMVLTEINRVFGISQEPKDWQNITDNPFVSAYMDSVSTYSDMFLDNHIDMHEFEIISSRTSMSSNIMLRTNHSLLVEAGVPFHEFVVSCKYADTNCGHVSNFTQFFDMYYYNCYTFNPHSLNAESGSELLAEGIENGLSVSLMAGSGMLLKHEDVRFIPGSWEHFSSLSGNEGVRVVIHPANSTPYPHTEGFDVPPNFSASLGVRARQNHRLPQPYGDCINRSPFGDQNIDGNTRASYRPMTCQKLCLQQAVVKKCDCKDIELPGQDLYPQTQYCADDSAVPCHCRTEITDVCVKGLKQVAKSLQCQKEVVARTQRNATAMIQCGCFPACNEVAYDVTYSLARWPGDNYEGDQAYLDMFYLHDYLSRFQNGSEKHEMYSRYFHENNRNRSLKDFARINVYISDSSVLKTLESEDYTVVQLLSDIGGQLGLWIGVSVITVVEILELIADVGRWFRHPIDAKPRHAADQTL